MPGAHVQALTAGGVVHVPHEHPQFPGAMQPAPPALVVRRQDGHAGQHTDVHWYPALQMPSACPLVGTGQLNMPSQIVSLHENEPRLYDNQREMRSFRLANMN